MGTAALANVLACLDATADELHDTAQQLLAALETWRRLRSQLAQLDPTLATTLERSDKTLRSVVGTRVATLREQEATVRAAARLVKRTDPATLP